MLTSDPHCTQDPDLAAVAKLLATARSLDEIVSILRTNARRIIGSDGIAVILREGDFCRYVAEDAFEPLWLGQRFPLEGCVSGWAMLHNQSVAITDIEGDPRVPTIAYGRTSMRSLAIVPIGDPTPVAALGAYWCAFVEIDTATLRRMEILAHIVSAAMARIDPNRTRLASA